jgi:beta-glucosidase
VGRNGEKLQRLVGFQRVSLAPGASQKVTVTIDPRLLANWQDGGWTMPAGSYSFALGRNAEDLSAPVTVRMAGKTWK